LLELLGRRLVQVIDLSRIGRDKGIEGIEFLGIAQLFRKHDLADLFGNGHEGLKKAFDVGARPAGAELGG